MRHVVKTMFVPAKTRKNHPTPSAIDPRARVVAATIDTTASDSNNKRRRNIGPLDSKSRNRQPGGSSDRTNSILAGSIAEAAIGPYPRTGFSRQKEVRRQGLRLSLAYDRT